METIYPVFIIYSNWNIDKMKAFLLKYDIDGVCMLKMIYDNSGSETNKTIAILSNNLYDKLIAEEYNVYKYNVDFKIKRYKLGDFLLPPKDKSDNLFIPIIKKTTETYVTDIINNKLSLFAKFDIIPYYSWKIKCPLSSTGIDNGVLLGCFIFFKKTINIYNIGIIKFLLHNTYWEETGGKKYDNMIKCYWAKHKK
jgi:hypothetical protein